MKEVLIQSERNDKSTDDVLPWLYYLDNNVVVNKFYDNYAIESIDIEMSNKNSLKASINNIEIENQNYIWYRRGQLFTHFDNSGNYPNIQGKVHKETLDSIREFLEGNITVNNINTFKDNFINKLDMLYLAMSLDIKIPDVLVTGNSNKLLNFVTTNQRVITKPIKNPLINLSQGNVIVNFITSTKLLDIKDISLEKFDFLPSFFQKYIEKKYEIRSFYLNGVFKSMAIFSQQNEKTKIDFRNYDHKKPNRCIPYLLPKKLENKLHKLMMQLDLNCGSFDIICTPNNEFYFLEVNPIGQFQRLSRHCNYYIERLIAQKMISHE